MIFYNYLTNLKYNKQKINLKYNEQKQNNYTKHNEVPMWP